MLFSCRIASTPVIMARYLIVIGATTATATTYLSPIPLTNSSHQQVQLVLVDIFLLAEFPSSSSSSSSSSAEWNNNDKDNDNDTNTTSTPRTPPLTEPIWMETMDKRELLVQVQQAQAQAQEMNSNHGSRTSRTTNSKGTTTTTNANTTMRGTMITPNCIAISWGSNDGTVTIYRRVQVAPVVAVVGGGNGGNDGEGGGTQNMRMAWQPMAIVTPRKSVMTAAMERQTVVPQHQSVQSSEPESQKTKSS